MNYIFLYFVPGSAGNFVSRCLHLLPKTHVVMALGSANANFFDETIGVEEKLRILNYDSVLNRDSKKVKTQNWIDFENQKTQYSNPREHNNLPNGYTAIILNHTWVNSIESYKKLPGSTDTCSVFYIDYRDNLTWCQLNALYKNSILSDEYIKGYNIIKQQPESIPIDLSNIIDGGTALFKEIHKICDISKIDRPAPEVEDAIRILHQQWKTTVFDINNFNKVEK